MNSDRFAETGGDLGRQHLFVVLRVIAEHGEMFQSDVMKVTKIPKTRVSIALNECVQAGFLTIRLKKRSNATAWCYSIAPRGVDRLKAIDETY